MTVAEQINQDPLLYELDGEFDFSACKKFMDAIFHATRRDQVHVIIDLRGITYADDSAASLLVIAYQTLIQHHRRLRLLNTPEQLAIKLHSMNFPQIFPIFTSLEEALMVPWQTRQVMASTPLVQPE